VVYENLIQMVFFRLRSDKFGDEPLDLN